MAPKRTTRQGATARSRQTTRSETRSSSARSRKTAPSTPSRKPRITAAQIRRRRMVLVPLIVVGLLAVAAWAYYPVAKVQYREQRDKSRLEAELVGLKMRNQKLRAQVDRLKTPEGVEEVARESLGLVKEGENLYVVMDGEEATPTLEPDTATKATATEDDLWQRALDTLFGLGE